MASRSNGRAASRSNGRPRVNGTRAIILAGGRGTRLAPYTSILPKPLMPIGERAILEIVVEQLAQQGFTDITFSVGYLSHLIRAVFDNRADPNVTIRYVQEDNALGTAGPLRLVEGLDETFLMMNGDILTTLDYRDLVRFHRRNRNVLTIATHERTVKFDYGVLHLSNGDRPGPSRVRAFEEKPEVASNVSMGVYVLEPSALAHVPESEHFDVPELVQALLGAGEPVGAYSYGGVWFDIGRKDDYELAVSVWADVQNRSNGTNGRRK
jgi:NDP-sugar pyrophosphorylase family protein